MFTFCSFGSEVFCMRWAREIRLIRVDSGASHLFGGFRARCGLHDADTPESFCGNRTFPACNDCFREQGTYSIQTGPSLSSFKPIVCIFLCQASALPALSCSGDTTDYVEPCLPRASVSVETRLNPQSISPEAREP